MAIAPEPASASPALREQAGHRDRVCVWRPDADHGPGRYIDGQGAHRGAGAVELDVSTLADWVGAAAAALMPLVEVIRAHVSGRVCVDRQQKNAIREARALGLITMEERRRRGQPSLTNIVRTISSEWLAWLRIGPKAPGVKKLTSTVSKSPKKKDSGEAPRIAFGLLV